MVESIKLIKKYGNPTMETLAWERRNMKVWNVPPLIHLAIPQIPSRIYMHRVFIPVAEQWLKALIEAGVSNEIKTFDGCFNIRTKRGAKSLSIHAFGMAIDLNAAHNPLGLSRQQCLLRGLIPFTEKFINVSRKYVDCGADWQTRPDLMHFQIKGAQAYGPGPNDSETQ